MSALEQQVLEVEIVTDDHEYQFSGNSVTVSNKRRFVDEYRKRSTVFHAAAHVGVARKTVYAWIKSDPQFAEAVADSFEDAADVMETSAYEDALGRDGKRGDPLLKMFWLKAHRPKFRDRVAVDLNVVQREIETMLAQVIETKQIEAPPAVIPGNSAPSPTE